jgi:hypothetical protein
MASGKHSQIKPILLKEKETKMTNQSNVAGRSSLRAILTTVIAILLIVLTFASTALADSFNHN